MSTCNICGSPDNLVKDHNHKTGLVRGKLCQQCNSYLGVFEANLSRAKQRGRRRFKEWVCQFRAKIEAHLLCTTDEIYEKSGKETFHRMMDSPLANPPLEPTL